MRKSLTEVVVGAGVLIAAGGFLAYAVQATGFSGSNDDVRVTASFRSAEGLSVGTEVRLAGVAIGTVSAMTLNTESYRAETVLSLTRAVPIPDDSAAIVASEGILGGNFVEIVPGGSELYFASGGEITDTQGAVSLLQLLLTYVGGDEAPT